MNLWILVRRNLRQHAVACAVTVTALALAGGLLMAVWTIKVQTQVAFTQVNSGFDAVLGPRGAKLQLVLNSIFHLETSAGNITGEDYQQIKRHPAVKRAIPIAVGDNLQGFRIVGTDPELFREVEYRPGQKYAFAAGTVWNEGAHEAVVGSFAAERLGLGVGSEFHPSHGVGAESHDHEEHYRVSGVLRPTNTPVDRVVWIPLEGLQKMSGHSPTAANEVSAVLIQLRAPAAGFLLDQAINRQGTRLTLAYPLATIVSDLFSKIAWIDRVLGLVAYLVAAVSLGMVLVSIYSVMASRRRELAVMRALGARRATLFSVVLLEASVLGLFGAIGSFATYAVLAGVVAQRIQAEAGVVIDPWAYHQAFMWAPIGMVVLSALAGLLPAVSAYRTDVAANLSPQS